MYLVKRDEYWPYWYKQAWYFNKTENAINKAIECFNDWIEEEYDGDIQKWEEETEWNYEEEIAAIKTGTYAFEGILKMEKIETED